MKLFVQEPIHSVRRIVQMKYAINKNTINIKVTNLFLAQ